MRSLFKRASQSWSSQLKEGEVNYEWHSKILKKICVKYSPRRFPNMKKLIIILALIAGTSNAASLYDAPDFMEPEVVPPNRGVQVDLSYKPVPKGKYAGPFNGHNGEYILVDLKPFGPPNGNPVPCNSPGKPPFCDNSPPSVPVPVPAMLLGSALFGLYLVKRNKNEKVS